MPACPMRGIIHEKQGRMVHTMQKGNSSSSGLIITIIITTLQDQSATSEIKTES